MVRFLNEEQDALHGQQVEEEYALHAQLAEQEEEVPIPRLPVVDREAIPLIPPPSAVRPSPSPRPLQVGEVAGARIATSTRRVATFVSC